MGCKAQKRINNILDRNPDLKIADTIKIHDTITIPEVKMDTVMMLDLDTVVIEKDNLRIKTVRINDSIFIEGKCLTDTVFLEKKIPIEKVIYLEDTPWTDFKKFVRNWWRWLIGLIVVFIAYRVAKRFI